MPALVAVMAALLAAVMAAALDTSMVPVLAAVMAAALVTLMAPVLTAVMAALLAAVMTVGLAVMLLLRSRCSFRFLAFSVASVCFVLARSIASSASNRSIASRNASCSPHERSSHEGGVPLQPMYDWAGPVRHLNTRQQ